MSSSYVKKKTIRNVHRLDYYITKDIKVDLTYVQLFFYSSSSTLIIVCSKKFRKLFDSFLGAFLQAAANNIYKHEFSCSFVCQERYRVNVVSPFVIGR